MRCGRPGGECRMKRLTAACLAILLVFSLAACQIPRPRPEPPPPPINGGETPTPDPEPEPVDVESRMSLELEQYDGGFFTLQKPVGWEIITGGEYGSFAFLLRDPENPARQIMYLGEIVPFYMSQEQKDIDANYMNTGGYKVKWYDMPVVDPLKPSQLFVKFNEIAGSEIGQGFMPQLPRLEQFEVLAENPVESPFPVGETSLTRGVFVQDGVPCEGQFLATVAEFAPPMNGPGGGTGIAAQVAGIMAPTAEFYALQDDLLTCIGSFRLSDQYVQDGIAQSQENFKGVMKAGETLRETSDIINDGWEARNRSDDILSQKRSDATLGYDRVYDPNTDEVYHVPIDFYEDYDINRGQYDMSDLQLLPPDDQTLWTIPPKDGSQIR